MNVYVLMPTACAPHVYETVGRWRSRGYQIAAYCDLGKTVPGANFVIQGAYKGVWHSANQLAFAAFERGADVCVFAGDDMDPDPDKRADEIAAEYLERFPDGYGVMQPCGDIQGAESWEAYSARCPFDAAYLAIQGWGPGVAVPAAARICGSAWFGRAWALEAYEGRGPTNADYHHFYADEELAAAARMQGVMWWRPDLTQFHRHWSFGHLPKQEYHERNQAKWTSDQNLFNARKAAGFPQSGRRS